MGFFDDLSAPEPAPPRRHHPWEPPEAEFPGIVPIDTLLLGRTNQVAVAVTGLSAFSAGIEIFLTARIRPSSGHPGEHLPGGPRDLAASRRSFRFGLQFSDGNKAAGSPGGGRTDHDSEPAGPVLYPFAGGGGPHSFVSRWWTWPLPPAGPLEFVCEWPRSASPNPGPASTRSSSSTRPGAASDYGRKTEADGRSLAANRRWPGPGYRGATRFRRAFGAADGERPGQRQAVRAPPIVTWTLPGPATLLRPQHVLCQIRRHGGPLSRSRPGPGRQPACGSPRWPTSVAPNRMFCAL